MVAYKNLTEQVEVIVDENIDLDKKDEQSKEYEELNVKCDNIISKIKVRKLRKK